MSRKIYEEMLPYLQIFPEGIQAESETESEIETASEADPQTDTSAASESGDESQTQENDQSSGTVSDVHTDDKTMVWKHLTEDEKKAVQDEYLNIKGTNKLKDWKTEERKEIRKNV